MNEVLWQSEMKSLKIRNLRVSSGRDFKNLIQIRSKDPIEKIEFERQASSELLTIQGKNATEDEWFRDV